MTKIVREARAIEVIDENLDEQPTPVASSHGYNVCSWSPGRVAEALPCTEVHVVLPVDVDDLHIRVALRLKSAHALDELVGSLLALRKEVWGGSGS